METAKDLGFISTLLPVAIVIFIIAVGVVLLTQQFRKNLYLQKLKQEELKNQHQIELLRSSIQVQEEERKRIARDMHDELGATLAITRMHLLQAERQHGAKDEKLLADLQNIRSLTETSLNSMRQISHLLMPPQLDTFGLVKTLEVVAAQINKADEIKLELIFGGELPELNWPVKLAFYRIFMELINNTIKHAEAKLITIELSFDGKNVCGVYRDNGKGIEEGKTKVGIGQKSIQGRVHSLGGSIVIGNHAQGGLITRIEIPL
ncbi:MAG: sensor histidine kinase [Bacteroidia bacterium]|nr:sensor histidine kinase [Bacteroidia bacterium]